MRQVQPIVRTFRNLLQRFGVIANRNLVFRTALEQVEKVFCLLTCRGEIITDSVEVEELTLVRYGDEFAKRTVIVNHGDSKAAIFEDGRIVQFVPPNSSKELSLTGRLTIQAKCYTGSTTLHVTTFRRCACGDKYIPPYGQIIDPIGGDLI